jgi:hypothetical protein
LKKIHLNNLKLDKKRYKKNNKFYKEIKTKKIIKKKKMEE